MIKQKDGKIYTLYYSYKLEERMRISDEEEITKTGIKVWTNKNVSRSKISANVVLKQQT